MYTDLTINYLTEENFDSIFAWPRALSVCAIAPDSPATTAASPVSKNPDSIHFCVARGGTSQQQKIPNFAESDLGSTMELDSDQGRFGYLLTETFHPG